MLLKTSTMASLGGQEPGRTVLEKVCISTCSEWRLRFCIPDWVFKLIAYSHNQRIPKNNETKYFYLGNVRGKITS